MGDLNKNEEIKIKALLEAYSISDISTTFKQIDNKLLALHKCSADDFLQLNSDFKKLYAQSKLISDNVDVIVDTINNKDSKETQKEVYSFYERLREQAIIVDEKLALTMSFLEDLVDKLRYSFFPIRNYNQNLMSLKYLITNLDLTINISESSGNKTNWIEAITENIDHTKLLTEKITKSLNNLRKVCKSIHSDFQQFKNHHEDNIETLLSGVKERINRISLKYQKNQQCIPQIRKRTDKSSESINDIIKKLQYQDIIQQKMEHIQKTHKDLIQEIIDLEKSSKGEQHLNDKAKFFLRIRDIAGLQAAQLIHANKEYQSAIQIIINNFIQVGDNMKSISEMCEDIHFEDESDEVKLVDEIIDQITITESNFRMRIDKNKKFKNDLLLVDRKLEQSENYVKVLRKNSLILDENLEKSLNDVKNQLSKEAKISDSIKQIKNLHNEIKKNSSGLDNILIDLTPIKRRIQRFMDEFNSLTINEDFNKIKENVSLFNSVRKDIDAKLDENREISNTALKSIKKSISEIKYYDFFENTIEQIIKELNTINYNLKVDENEDLGSVEENLAKIKQYYTMETEHQIHDQVSAGEEIDVDSDEDGDIEFF